VTGRHFASPRDLYRTRRQFNAIKDARDHLMIEDITNLKPEKQNLIHERTLLKAKLARYATYNRHPKSSNRRFHPGGSEEARAAHGRQSREMRHGFLTFHYAPHLYMLQ
jgi:hypothetical protein